jgi:predicted small secreted protein
MNKKKTLIGTGTIFAALAVLGGTLLKRKIIKNKQAQEVLKNDTYETGSIRKLGTLYLNATKQKFPTDLAKYDDVYEYMGEKIEIKNSDKSDENKLSWVEINDNDKKLLICDRNILKGVSWDELNNQNLVFGKVVIIDEQKYILRLLKGGDKKNDNLDNEWNRYIINEDQLLGLPLSTESDKSEKINNSNLDKINGENNRLWHWIDICSLTQNLKREKSCIIRGFYSNTYINDVKKEVSYKTVGYRPVLEAIS